VTLRFKTQHLADLYAEQCATPSDIYEHLPVFVDLVRTMDAKHVIELGTRTGVSTYAWLYALEQTGGRLTSVDIDAKPPIGDYDHWTFIQGDDLDPAVYAQLEPADIVFVDTSHLYDQTVHELNLYRWLVKPGGVMVLHDTELPQPEGAPPRPQYPVKTAIVEFCEANGYEWTNRTNCWGLGVIQL
jgi:predicted O-methyltransferase YrrM